MNKARKSVTIDLPDGRKLDARFGGHPLREPLISSAAVWIVPKDYPTGTFAVQVVATVP